MIRVCRGRGVPFFLKIIYIKALRLDKYVGKTIKGIYITESGLIAGAHLLGVGNVKKFLKSNGRKIPRDGYGTPITEYLSRFSGYDISEITGTPNIALSNNEREEKEEDKLLDEYLLTKEELELSKKNNIFLLSKLIRLFLKLIKVISKKS